MADEFGRSGQITAIHEKLFSGATIIFDSIWQRLLPGSQPVAPVGIPRCKEQNPGGEIDPGCGQTTMRGWATYVMRNPLDGLRPSAREESMGHDIETRSTGSDSRWCGDECRHGARGLLRQSGRAAARSDQRQEPGERHRSGPAESCGRRSVSLGGISACDRRRRHADDLGILQQRATAHPERRLGASGHTGRLRDFRDDRRRQHATGGRGHPRIALAPGGRMGVHDLRQLPGHCSRHERPALCDRCEGGGHLVFPRRLPAFAAGARPRRVRVRHLLRQWRRERVQHPFGDRALRRTRSRSLSDHRHPSARPKAARCRSPTATISTFPQRLLRRS